MSNETNFKELSTILKVQLQEYIDGKITTTQAQTICKFGDTIIRTRLIELATAPRKIKKIN